jgi:polysaccharide deacetylase 2 family uncharacterized protein YibQ
MSPFRLSAASLGLSLGIVGAAAGVALVTIGPGDARFVSGARVEMGLPPLTRSEPAPSPIEAATGASTTHPDLLEPSPFGPLPRVAASGERPIFAYASHFDLEDSRPKIAVLLLGLGLQRAVTEAALALPAHVGLQFSPYAPNIEADVSAARRGGHEVLLGLPMEPPAYPENDPGPHTLLAHASPDANLDRLLWLLSRATGYVGVAGDGGVFAQSPAAEPVVRELAARGLALVEIGEGGLTEEARAAGLPYARAAAALDADPTPRAIDRALAELEAEALDRGSALGVAIAYPLSIERLRAWIAGLEAKSLVLAPVSALLIEGAGLAARLRGEAGAGDPSAS